MGKVNPSWRAAGHPVPAHAAGGGLTTWQELGWPQRKLLIEAAFSLLAGSAAIRVLPFRRLAACLQWRGRAPDLAPANWPAEVARGRWAVEATARRAPWRAKCFEQGLALHFMLRRRGIPSQFRYGVGREPDGRLSAHVWLSLGDTIILGETAAEQHHCLLRAPDDPAAAERAG